jgi:hypothetical protein
LGCGDFFGSVGKGKQTKFYFRPQYERNSHDEKWKDVCVCVFLFLWGSFVVYLWAMWLIWFVYSVVWALSSTCNSLQRRIKWQTHFYVSLDIPQNSMSHFCTINFIHVALLLREEVPYWFGVFWRKSLHILTARGYAVTFGAVVDDFWSVEGTV